MKIKRFISITLLRYCMHVAASPLDRLIDYVMNNAGRSGANVGPRAPGMEMIQRNLNRLKNRSCLIRIVLSIHRRQIRQKHGKRILVNCINSPRCDGPDMRKEMLGVSISPEAHPHNLTSFFIGLQSPEQDLGKPRWIRYKVTLVSLVRQFFLFRPPNRPEFPNCRLRCCEFGPF